MSIIQQYERSSLPLAIKWSLAISVLIILVMGLLGWILVDKQKELFQRYTSTLGIALVDQLAHLAGEPLLAEDTFALQLLVNRQEENDLVVGIQVFDLDGKSRVNAGFSPFGFHSSENFLSELLEDAENGREWRVGHIIAQMFARPIEFKDLEVGYALVSLDKRPLQQDLEEIVSTLLNVTLGLILLGVVLAAILAQRLSQPITRLAKMGEALSNGYSHDFVPSERGDEIGKVLNSFKNMAVGLEGKREVEQALSRYVSPTIAQRLIDGSQSAELGGSTVDASVLFCDIVGFTELAESLEPEQVSDLLNHYFHYFSLASTSCDGTVDKFIGDCIMIIFGVPEEDPHHALHAVTCGVLIQTIAERVTRQRKALGQPTVEFKVGINTGPVLAGNLGGEDRMQFTVVGDTVNVASRLCDQCSPGEILVTEDTSLANDVMENIEFIVRSRIHVRGRVRPVTHYHVDINSFAEADQIKQHLENIFTTEVQPA